MQAQKEMEICKQRANGDMQAAKLEMEICKEQIANRRFASSKARLKCGDTQAAKRD